MSLLAFKSDKHAFRVFSSEGKPVKYQKMLENLEGADIVFFGELHDNPIAHWLQYELTRDLYNIEGENLVLAAEMFEADNQLLMNEYLGGQISEKKFEEEMRLWNNYKTDYKPLVDKYFMVEQLLSESEKILDILYFESKFVGVFKDHP